MDRARKESDEEIEEDQNYIESHVGGRKLVIHEEFKDGGYCLLEGVSPRKALTLGQEISGDSMGTS